MSTGRRLQSVEDDLIMFLQRIMEGEGKKKEESKELRKEM